MRIYASTRPLPLPVTKCCTERTPSLKRDVINEWPLRGLASEAAVYRTDFYRRGVLGVAKNTIQMFFIQMLSVILLLYVSHFG